MEKALFLDRDGVVNIEKNYLYKIDDFEFINGVFELCKYYRKLGYLIFIVTNQSGIARGYYNVEDFKQLTLWMKKLFLEQDIVVEKVYFCPHHPDISGECSCRKPNPGMLIQAQKEFDLDMQNSILIGDKESDIEAALNAGLRETYLYDKAKCVVDSKATKIVNNLNDIWK